MRTDQQDGPRRDAQAVTAGQIQAHAPTSATARLFKTEVGRGRNVMFLHGWTGDSHDWNGQLPLFESRYRVVAVDLRGHGRSEIMPPGSYMPDDYVADIEALIATEYPGEEFVIVGHSMGGQIAARLAARRPDMVSAVVSIDGSLGFSDEMGELFANTAHALTVGDPGVVASALFQQVYDPSTDPAFKLWHGRRAQGMPAGVVRETFGPLFVGDAQVGVGAASARFCQSLQVPVYHLCRDAAQADRMRPWFSHPRSKVDVWSHAGHWIMQDRQEDVNAAVTAWIDAAWSISPR